MKEKATPVQRPFCVPSGEPQQQVKQSKNPFQLNIWSIEVVLTLAKFKAHGFLKFSTALYASISNSYHSYIVMVTVDG